MSVIQEDDGSLWFIGNQVTKMLGHQDTTSALLGIPHEWKKVIKYDNFKSDVLDKFKDSDFVGGDKPPINSKTRKLTIISEGALYYLVSRGKTEMSKYFNKWLFGEVVPTIRTHGFYIQQDLLCDNKRLREKINTYRNEVATKAITIAELDNRDLYGDCDDSCTDDEIERGYAHANHIKRNVNLL